ncbi:NADP-dependent oxidoreductase domain-containing protein [Hypoxylon rubiginosum]|uniref:NADP-dependent oxidoreductase domain-containing protein n=1 Tax=Hypoxylon rubiginosum TaxID=110542 RepID=A0ACB9ZEM3_9PEZI|nr:NADP-dependent oxidoreductase domain-containing protein [Hypoxylon rubiginosum]
MAGLSRLFQRITTPFRHKKQVPTVNTSAQPTAETTKMPSAKPLSTGPVGFGLMGMTWRANQTPDEQAFAAMKAAVTNGATFWSTADFYGTSDPTAGLGLVRRYFEKYPADASKVTLFVKGCADPKSLYPTNNRAGVRTSVDNCLRALGGAKKIDVFGPTRQDPSVPLEETVGELKRLVEEGKIGGIGMSEVGAETTKKAHAIYPLSLIEVEFSLWSTEILTNGVAATAKSLNIPIVAYSPLGRGFLTGQLKSVKDIPEGDIRLYFDRFQPENFDKNLELVDKLKAFAQKAGVTPAQLALAWVLSNSNSGECGTIVPIPGATTAQRVEENTKQVKLSSSQKAELDAILNSVPISGGRYNPQLEMTLWG